jgi:DNA-binding MarR family transcriptional regulator
MERGKAELLEMALRAYVRVLTIVDPIRLRFWGDRDLTMPQLRVMFILAERGVITPGALAETMHVTPSTVTGLTDRLAKQRLILRREDPSDRRSVCVSLSEEGRQAISDLEAAGRAYLKEILEKLPAEHLERLAALLEEFKAAAESVQSERPLV